MRICLLGMKGNFDASTGQGVQKYIYHTWKNLERLQNRYGSLDKIELGIGNSLPLRKVSFTLLSLIHDFNDYDIIHIPAPILCNPLRRGNAKIITTLHELILVDKDSPYARAMEKEKKPNPIVSGVSRFMGNQVRKQILSSDELIANSTQTRDEAVKEGYDKSRIHIIRWGLDERFLKGYNKPARGFTVGYFGSINVRKNVGFAIRAFKKIDDSGMRFKIYGKGPEYDSIAKLAGDDKRITLMGFAAESRSVAIYDSFSVFVFPSLYEGLCLPILEAQARGLPVIIYKHSNIPRETRKYCFEAEDEEHMAEIIADIKENGYDERLRRRAKEYVGGFTWENAANETIEVYRKACR
jgi:glycosyltransferase involved in cell wall biosynthesis